MKNEAEWKPGRFVVSNGKLRITDDPSELSVSSRLITSLVADAYNEHFHKHCRGRLLDLGCGKSPFYEFYREHVDETVCADWGSTLHGGRYLDVVCDLTQPLPFSDEEFDTVLLSDVLEHIPTPQALMNEISRILRKDGKLILNAPFMYWLHEVPHDYHRYTEYALRRMAEHSGLQVLILESLGGPLAVMTDIAAKMFVRVPVIGRFLASAIQNSCRLWMTLSSKHGRKRPIDRLFPSEYFMVAQK